jgi:CRISPR/Cas system-associated endoribonuclease Cas2
MYILITYDISDKNPEVKAAMLEKRYKDRFSSNGKMFYLPNTTLLIRAADTTPNMVRREFEAIIEEINASITLPTDKIRIERCFVAEFSNCSGITGDEHSDI